MKYLIEIPSSNVNLIDQNDERWKIQTKFQPDLPPIQVNYGALLMTLFIAENGRFLCAGITFLPPRTLWKYPSLLRGTIVVEVVATVGQDKNLCGHIKISFR